MLCKSSSKQAYWLSFHQIKKVCIQNLQFSANTLLVTGESHHVMYLMYCFFSELSGKYLFIDELPAKLYNTIYTTSLLAQRSGARKVAPAEILVLASDTGFQGFQNSLCSDRLQSLSEIPCFTRGFLTVMNLMP